MNEIEKQEIFSLTKNFGDAAIDSFFNDGLFKDIPLLGTSVSIFKLLSSISDRRLLVKLLKFVNELGLHSQEEINDFKYRYLKDEDYKKIGSRLLFVLEKADNLTKIKWLAKCLRLFVDGKIMKNEFLRLCSIINISYVEDMLQINAFGKRKRITAHNNIVEAYVLEHLFSIGLIQNKGYDGGDALGENSGNVYELNKFGKIMKDFIVYN